LQVLYLNDNYLTEIPAELGRLFNLRYLYLGGNQIYQVPIEIERLNNLIIINNNIIID